MTIKRFLSWKYFRRGIYLLAGCTVITNHVGEIIYCDGVSMEPSVRNGDIIIGEKISVSLMNLHHGDIVCAYSPSHYPVLLCKRLMFKEYDKLPDDLQTLNLARIPSGHCYLLGDNVKQSIDSRTFGPISTGLIQVRLVFRIWPIDRFGSISQHGIWEYEAVDTA